MPEPTRLAPHIVSDPRALAGYPVIEGTMLEAAFIGEMYRRGVSVEKLVGSYRLTTEQVEACIAFWAGVKWQRKRHAGKRGMPLRSM